jgi:sugar/nucleoside kinase (ribokinase family)
MKMKSALSIGQVGQDELLIPQGPVVRGGKVAAKKIVSPGYFALNVAVRLADAGIPTTLVSVVGGDPAGGELLALTHELGIHTYVHRVPDRPTPSSTILVENGERTVFRTEDSAARYWGDEHIPWHLFDQEPFLWMALGHLPADWDGSITCRLIRAASRVEIPVSWTPGGTQIGCKVGFFAEELRLLRLLVMNREEAVTFCELPAEKTPLDAIRALASFVGEQTIIVVTDGGTSPAVCYDAAHHRIYEIPPVPIAVVDPTGAGDVVHAELASGLIRGMELTDALEQARRRAAAICTVWGSIGPAGDVGGTGDASLHSAPAILSRNAPWRRRGRGGLASNTGVAAPLFDASQPAVLRSAEAPAAAVRG